MTMTTDFETDRPQVRVPGGGAMSRVRAALWVTLVGSVIFWIGLPFPVVTDFFESETSAERIALVDGERTQFAVAFGLLGLGAAVVGVGLWLLGRAIAPIEAERGRRRGRAAQTAGWLGFLGVAMGLSRLLHAVFATPEYMEGGDNIVDPVVGVIGGLGTSIALIVFGVLAWSAPPPKWTAVVLVLGGVAAAVTFLPLFWYFALIVFAIANLIVMRRRATSPKATATTPAA
jgi:hypothetical protein